MDAPNKIAWETLPNIIKYFACNKKGEVLLSSVSMNIEGDTWVTPPLAPEPRVVPGVILDTNKIDWRLSQVERPGITPEILWDLIPPQYNYVAFDDMRLVLYASRYPMVLAGNAAEGAWANGRDVDKLTYAFIPWEEDWKQSQRRRPVTKVGDNPWKAFLGEHPQCYYVAFDATKALLYFCPEPMVMDIQKAEWRGRGFTPLVIRANFTPWVEDWKNSMVRYPLPALTDAGTAANPLSVQDLWKMLPADYDCIAFDAKNKLYVAQHYMWLGDFGEWECLEDEPEPLRINCNFIPWVPDWKNSHITRPGKMIAPSALKHDHHIVRRTEIRAAVEFRFLHGSIEKPEDVLYYVEVSARSISDIDHEELRRKAQEKVKNCGIEGIWDRANHLLEAMKDAYPSRSITVRIKTDTGLVSTLAYDNTPIVIS